MRPCRPQYYYWESVTQVRNLLLVALVFVAPGMGVYIQANLVLPVLVFFLLVQQRIKPFKNATLDHMELVSIGKRRTPKLVIMVDSCKYSHSCFVWTQVVHKVLAVPHPCHLCCGCALLL